ncbi:hypothetical protein T484DRAFT_1834849 [Baffinella frigidus]|nr:hypothetical protein T484DRAFT_1834849 [Cryptophyta sp. CCMP2293]
MRFRVPHLGASLLLLVAGHLIAPATCSCNNVLVTQTNQSAEDPTREYLRMHSVSYPTTVAAGATFTVSGQATGVCNMRCSGCVYRTFLGIQSSTGCGGATASSSACCTQDWNNNIYAAGVSGHWNSLSCSRSCTYSAFSASFTAPSTPGCYPLRWDVGSVYCTDAYVCPPDPSMNGSWYGLPWRAPYAYIKVEWSNLTDDSPTPAPTPPPTDDTPAPAPPSPPPMDYRPPGLELMTPDASDCQQLRSWEQLSSDARGKMAWSGGLGTLISPGLFESWFGFVEWRRFVGQLPRFGFRYG